MLSNRLSLASVRLSLLLLSLILTSLSCQQSSNRHVDEKPTLKKTLAEVWVEFDPKQKPGVKPSLAMTDVFDLPAGGLEIVLAHPYRISQVEFVFEMGDRYRLEMRSGDTVHTNCPFSAPFVSALDDLFPASFVLMEANAARYTDNIRIIPDSGDGHYRAGHFSFLSND